MNRPPWDAKIASVPDLRTSSARTAVERRLALALIWPVVGALAVGASAWALTGLLGGARWQELVAATLLAALPIGLGVGWFARRQLRAVA